MLLIIKYAAVSSANSLTVNAVPETACTAQEKAACALLLLITTEMTEAIGSLETCYKKCYRKWQHAV